LKDYYLTSKINFVMRSYMLKTLTKLRVVSEVASDHVLRDKLMRWLYGGADND